MGHEEHKAEFARGHVKAVVVVEDADLELAGAPVDGLEALGPRLHEVNTLPGVGRAVALAEVGGWLTDRELDEGLAGGLDLADAEAHHVAGVAATAQ